MENNKEELQRCLDSEEYFYNNYCKKEGMPEYSKEQFLAYKKEAESKRNLILTKTRISNIGQSIIKNYNYFKSYPLTPNECFK